MFLEQSLFSYQNASEITFTKLDSMQFHTNDLTLMRHDLKITYLRQFEELLSFHHEKMVAKNVVKSIASENVSRLNDLDQV